jgi:peptidoglycan/xylan/chitin deacetylase (PgdA/CDA1 family)
VTAVRPVLKRAVERAILASGVPTWTRASRRSQVLILTYHDIRPDGVSATGDRSLHLPREAFARQLDALVRTHEVISLAALIGGVVQGRRPAAVITFDDAYRGAVTYGVSELAARNLPATFFIAPAFVGGRSFWWDAIARPRDSRADQRFREYALFELGGEDDRVRHWAAAQGWGASPVPEWARCASEDELERAGGHAGISFGAHSWSHPNLARLDEQRLSHELTAPLDWLRARFERVLECLAYPYGSFSPAVARAAAAAGYRMALRADGGWVRPGALDPMAAPRLFVPGEVSESGFRLRAAGLLSR